MTEYHEFLNDIAGEYRHRTDMAVAIASHLLHFFTNHKRIIGQPAHPLDRDKAMQIVRDWQAQG